MSLDQQGFEALQAKLFARAKQVGLEKAREYAHLETSDNRLLNFEVAQTICRFETAGQSILNYMVKSIMSLGFFAEDPSRSMNESLEDRCVDIMNYIVLFYAWGMTTEVPGPFPTVPQDVTPPDAVMLEWPNAKIALERPLLPGETVDGVERFIDHYVYRYGDRFIFNSALWRVVPA